MQLLLLSIWSTRSWFKVQFLAFSSLLPLQLLSIQASNIDPTHVSIDRSD